MKIQQFCMCLFFLSCLNSNLFSQDEKGLELLNSVEKKLLEADELTMDFNLQIFIPTKPMTNITGTFYKKKEKFILSSDKLDKISDGNSVWSIDKTQNIAYITSSNNAHSLSPLEIIQSYDKSSYEFLLVYGYMYAGKRYRAIIIKPKNKNTDYTKMRFIIDKNDNPLQFFLVQRNGIRYTFNFENVTYSLPEEEPAFTFRKDDYPGVMVEDLRLD